MGAGPTHNQVTAMRRNLLRLAAIKLNRLSCVIRIDHIRGTRRRQPHLFGTMEGRGRFILHMSLIRASNGEAYMKPSLTMWRHDRAAKQIASQRVKDAYGMKIADEIEAFHRENLGIEPL